MRAQRGRVRLPIGGPVGSPYAFGGLLQRQHVCCRAGGTCGKGRPSARRGLGQPARPTVLKGPLVRLVPTSYSVELGQGEQPLWGEGVPPLGDYCGSLALARQLTP
jgi:hypothetical protein